MEKIAIEKIGLEAIEQLQIISKLTFIETFAAVNTKENMEQYLAENLSVDQLIVELNNPFSEFYFASLDNKVIGYLKINFGLAQTAITDDSTLEIERIYVLKEFYGKGAGQVLYDAALEIAKKRKAPYLWLGVWEENQRAISFYKKNGLVAYDKHIFLLGDDKQTDILMKLNLLN